MAPWWLTWHLCLYICEKYEMSRLWRTDGRTDSRKVEQYSVWTESAKNFTIGITLHPLALLVISFAAFLQFSNRPRIWVSRWFKVGVGREQGVGRKSSVIGAWQKAPSRGTLPHSQPTFAIETHIHITFLVLQHVKSIKWEGMDEIRSTKNDGPIEKKSKSLRTNRGAFWEKFD